MSFVTTPIRSSSRRLRQSAAINELLPEPTGPPTPIRSARSGGKEPPLAGRVRERAQLERRRERCRQVALVRDRLRREPADQRLRVEQPARRRRRVERQQPHGGGCDRRRVVVEERLRDLLGGEP